MKKPNESFIDFRRRMMDPVSPSFCAAKWLNSTVWLGSGTTASCHLPPAHRISPAEVRADPSALHNTVHKKIARAQMLRGERPTECEYCWKIEDLGPDRMSDRTFKTEGFEDEDIRALKEQPGTAPVFPRTLEIAFDRTCQFACSYCNASFSTRWGQDIQRHGAYRDLRTDGAGAYRHDGRWADPVSVDDNPYLKAFWDWWPRLAPELRELRVTGGEPLMSPQTWKLLDFLAENPQPKLRLAINSNLGLSDDRIARLIEASHRVREFDIYTSCEATGSQAEYIRDGLNFDRYVAVVDRLLTEGRLRHLHFMFTATSLALDSMDGFLDRVLEWKRKSTRTPVVFVVNILRFPSFMSPLVLPDDYLRERASALENWLSKNRGELRDFEIGSLERLIQYLREVESPHRLASPPSDMRLDFKSFFAQYDRRRSKNFATTFPRLAGWFEAIESQLVPGSDRLEDGDSTKGWHDLKELKGLAAREGLVYPDA